MKYDYSCNECQIYFSKHVPMSDYKKSQPCPECLSHCGRAYLAAPFTRVGGEGSDRSIKAMKKSFKQRFVTKELTDCRHKFGNTMDESFVSAAAQRIKDGVDDEVEV